MCILVSGLSPAYMYARYAMPHAIQSMQQFVQGTFSTSTASGSLNFERLFELVLSFVAGLAKQQRFTSNAVRLPIYRYFYSSAKPPPSPLGRLYLAARWQADAPTGSAHADLRPTVAPTAPRMRARSWRAHLLACVSAACASDSVGSHATPQRAYPRLPTGCA